MILLYLLMPFFILAKEVKFHPPFLCLSVSLFVCLLATSWKKPLTGFS